MGLHKGNVNDYRFNGFFISCFIQYLYYRQVNVFSLEPYCKKLESRVEKKILSHIMSYEIELFVTVDKLGVDPSLVAEF